MVLNWSFVSGNYPSIVSSSITPRSASFTTCLNWCVAAVLATTSSNSLVLSTLAQCRYKCLKNRCRFADHWHLMRFHSRSFGLPPAVEIFDRVCERLGKMHYLCRLCTCTCVAAHWPVCSRVYTLPCSLNPRPRSRYTSTCQMDRSVARRRRAVVRGNKGALPKKNRKRSVTKKEHSNTRIAL